MPERILDIRESGLLDKFMDTPATFLTTLSLAYAVVFDECGFECMEISSRDNMLCIHDPHNHLEEDKEVIASAVLKCIAPKSQRFILNALIGGTNNG